MPLHDKGLLQGICKHGIGRNDLLLNDPELPFYDIKQRVVQEESIEDPEGEGAPTVLEKLAWPRDLVVARRIDALCEQVLRPKPPPKRPASSRKRKNPDSSKQDRKQGSNNDATKENTANNEEGKDGDYVPNQHGYQSDEAPMSYGGYSDSGEDTDTMLEEASQRMNKRFKDQHEEEEVPTETNTTVSAGAVPPPDVSSHAQEVPTIATAATATGDNSSDDDMTDSEEGEDTPMVPSGNF